MHTQAGPVAQLLVGVVSVAEQGLVTTHRQLMGVANALPMVQVTLTQKSATIMHVQVSKSLSISEKCTDSVVCLQIFYRNTSILNTLKL